MTQTLKTGLTLLLLIMVIGAGTMHMGEMTKTITQDDVRTCRNTIAAVATQLTASMVQNPGIVAKLKSLSPVTTNVPVSVYQRSGGTTVVPHAQTASITTKPYGNGLLVTATMPSGTRCASEVALNPLALPNGTTTVANPGTQSSE